MFKNTQLKLPLLKETSLFDNHADKWVLKISTIIDESKKTGYSLSATGIVWETKDIHIRVIEGVQPLQW